MTDIRTAAHLEARTRYGTGLEPVIRRTGFEAGAVWAAARVTPTREQINAAAEEAFNEWWNQDVEGGFEGAFATKILALMQELAEGES